MEGWIKLHRKIHDCWIWQIDEPFDKRSAWVDLLLLANHKDVKLHFNSELILVQRGQFVTSIRKLSDRWKWSYDKVSRFLKLLESDGMIRKESDKCRTLVTIEKYSNFQDLPNTYRTPISEPTSEHSEHQRVTNKNDKNEKNERNSNGDLEEFFESIWTLYPVKRGKGSVSKTQKKKLQDIGYEQIKRCIESYVSEMENLHRDKKYWKNGSTFLNSGYVDYLDCNKDEKKKVVDVPEEETIIDLWSDV